MDSNYIKIYGGNNIEAKRIELALKENNIAPILKDEKESARLAGFGTPLPDFVQLFVHEDEEIKALALISKLNSDKYESS